jgi:hypothetical protein
MRCEFHSQIGSFPNRIVRELEIRKASTTTAATRTSGEPGHGRTSRGGNFFMQKRVHGRDAPGSGSAGFWLPNLTCAMACLAPKECVPDQTNCSPAKSATIATIVFNLCAGTFRASRQPITTPGTPPSSNCSNVDALIEPNVQWAILPMIAKTSPKRMSVPTTSVGVISE